MRTIERTSQFKRDYKREAKGIYRASLDTDLIAILTALTNDQPLSEKHRDHALTGNWKDHRDCHLKPDLLLIYRKPDDAVLQLVRLGSHSELGLYLLRALTYPVFSGTTARKIRNQIAGTNRSKVISDGTPKRLGGPQ
jgi:mRNA interferase YafQ